MLAALGPRLVRKAVLPGVRGVAFVAATRDSGNRARGLKRDPEEYMDSPSGVRYPGTAETLAPVRRFVGRYELSEPVMVQAVTHKSFAHAKVPYNEKLAILGQHIFRVEASRAAAAAPSTTEKFSEVNGNNFDVDQNAIELLTSTPVVARVCDKAGLEPAMFFKQATGHPALTIKAKAVHALIGAVSLQRGASEAVKFVNERLLQGELSVFDVADEQFVHRG